LTIFVKRLCTIFRTFLRRLHLFEHIDLPAKLLNYFLRSNNRNINQSPHSFMILNKSAKESHTLPPAKLLWQNSAGLASDFRLRLAFDVTSLDPLSFDVSLPLSACNFARVSYSSIHSANTIGERSNFLTLALHLLSVDGSSRPFQSTRFRYSCIRNWVARWSPCTLGTRTWTLYSPFDV